MGWRESLGDRYTADALMGLSAPDRIALARELLEGTGKVIEGEPVCPHYRVGCLLSANPMGAKRDVGVRP